MADVPDVELTPVPLPNVDLTPLTTAITKVAEDVVRTIAQDMVPYLLTQQVDESLKKLVPRLVQTAVSEEKVLIKETTQETTREALPDLLRPLVEQFAKEIFDMKDTVQETARHVAAEGVGAQRMLAAPRGRREPVEEGVLDRVAGRQRGRGGGQHHGREDDERARDGQRVDPPHVSRTRGSATV